MACWLGVTSVSPCSLRTCCEPRLGSHGSRGSCSLPYLVLTREVEILNRGNNPETSKEQPREPRELRESPMERETESEP
jgi:hypothetical protein